MRGFILNGTVDAFWIIALYPPLPFDMLRLGGALLVESAEDAKLRIL